MSTPMKNLDIYFAAFLIGISPVTASINQDASAPSRHTDVPGAVVNILENVTGVADNINQSLRKLTARQITRIKSGLLNDISHVIDTLDVSQNSVKEKTIESQAIPDQSTPVTESLLSPISSNDYQITLFIKKSTDGHYVYVLDIRYHGEKREIFREKFFIDSKDSVLL